MTVNAQVDHRKYVEFFHINHPGGQFEKTTGPVIGNTLFFPILAQEHRPS